MNKVAKQINNMDIRLLYVLNDDFKCNFLDKIMPTVTLLGGAFFSITTTTILIVVGKGILQEIGWQCLITLATSHVLVHYLKKRFTRPRPFLNLVDINTFNYRLHDYSFPSGHTTAVFSIATTVSIFFPIIAFLLITGAYMVGFSRVYLGVHYPSDVLVGMGIGVFFAFLNHILFNPWLILILS